MDSADGHHPRRRRAAPDGAVTPSTSTTSGGGGRPVAAAVVLATSLVLALVAIVLWWTNTPDWSEDQWYFLVDLADAVVYGTVAWVILARRSHPVGWILALTAIGGGLAAISFQWVIRLAADPALPELAPLPSAQQWGWVPGTLALVTIVPWRGRAGPHGPGARGAGAAGGLMTASLVVSRVTDPYPWPDGEPSAPFPIRSQAWVDLLEGAFRWQMVALVALGLAAAAGVAVRWRRSPGDRRGLGWLAIGATLLTLAFLPLAVTREASEVLPVWFTPVLHLSSQLFFPGALLVAVLRQRLWDLDLVVSRALVWSLLTAGVVASYLAVVAALGPLLTNDEVPEVLAAAVVAAGFQPARRWVQQRVDHLVRGRGATALGIVREVGSQLGTAGPADLVTAVAGSIAESLRLGSVAIEPAGSATAESEAGGSRPAGSGDDPPPARAGTLAPDADAAVPIAAVGVPYGPATVVPLVIRQTTVGRLLVTARPGERLDARTLASLDELAPVVAATVYLSTTAAELTRSRRRLAEARDEERRALRRELHDGLGPALAGIGLGLQAARNQLGHDPDQAGDLLDRLVAELEHRVEEVRGMARGLLPPALGDRGLGAALDELVVRYAVTGLHIDLQVGDPGGLLAVPDAVATAAYAIATEAVRNVHRHAGTSTCTVTVATDSAELIVTVADHGAGVARNATPGVGLSSMRERAEALGGTWSVDTVPGGGTRVEARMPLLAAVEVAS